MMSEGIINKVGRRKSSFRQNNVDVFGLRLMFDKFNRKLYKFKFKFNLGKKVATCSFPPCLTVLVIRMGKGFSVLGLWISALSSLQTW